MNRNCTVKMARAQAVSSAIGGPINLVALFRTAFVCCSPVEHVPPFSFQISDMFHSYVRICARANALELYSSLLIAKFPEKLRTLQDVWNRLVNDVTTPDPTIPHQGDFLVARLFCFTQPSSNVILQRLDGTFQRVGGMASDSRPLLRSEDSRSPWPVGLNANQA
jgi:hypothetical protein